MTGRVPAGRILVVIGTRPEAIKMAPVVHALARREHALDARLALTGQHTDLVDEALDTFGLSPDWDLEIMREGQSLAEVGEACLRGLDRILDGWPPDLVLVQGDTASVFFAALAGFFRGVPTGHVEAGLRTGDLWRPFPEEGFRRLAGVLAELHFAPTERARQNLLTEGVAASRIHLTGNPVVDALLEVAGRERTPDAPALARLLAPGAPPFLLLTAHRRESFGPPLENVFRAIRRLLDEVGDFEVLYPVHPNPRVSEPARAHLGDLPRVHLVPPLSYPDMVAALAAARGVLTDSGGLQEEAPTFGTPVLVLREVTERPEGIEAGVARLVGTDPDRIVPAAAELLALRPGDRARLREANPYGDGRAGERIAQAVEAFIERGGEGEGSRMRVLLHCVYYPPEIGGLESHVSALAEGLVERGHEVRVVTSASLPGVPAEEVLRGVRVRRTWFPARRPSGWVLHALGSLPATREWSDWADVLHAQAFASVVPVGICARLLSRPWVASFHTSHFLVRARRPLWRPVLRRLVSWPDHALAASREIAEVASALTAGTRVEALTNGVDTRRFHALRPAAGEQDDAGEDPAGERGRRRTVIVPRRLVPKNGVETLIRAVPQIVGRIPGLTVLVVGDGPERPRLEALATELGIADHVRFLGSRPHGEMPSLLASAELAVLPSLMEATSVAALEAMACAVPVVASAVGGLPEIVDDEVGGLVPPGDPTALAAGVVRLLEDRDLPRKGREGRARVVSSWSNDRLVERHLQIYGDLLAGRPVQEPSTRGTV